MLGFRFSIAQTRSIKLSEAGERYAIACRRMLTDLEEADILAAGELSAPRGTLTLTAPVTSGEEVLRPILDAFLDAYPTVSAKLNLLDRPVNLIDEGIDVALRIAHLPDSSMVAVRVGEVRRIVVAAPSYIAKHPRIDEPGDLANQQIIAMNNSGAGSWSFPARRWPDNLPDDLAELKRIIAATALDATTAQAEIARLKFQLARYRGRAEFGRSSEKLARDTEQLELALEGLETDQAERLVTASPEVVAAIETAVEAQKPARRPLPEHLPREDLRHPAPCTCPACGGALRKIGDEVSETLDYLPGRFKVVRHIREKLSCRVCDTVVAAPAPDHAIARGRAGAGLLAHIVVSKYDDHLPLYRQAEIFARGGVSLETSTLSGWVGATAAALQPLVDTLATDTLASGTLHVDDTPVPVLAPGTGKTKTGRLWTYVRDERPFAGARPPAALFFYSPDRKGEHPQAHLKDFRGVIHADGYAGFNELIAGGGIFEAACWAHVRRKFFDIHAATASPIAKEALERIAQLYAVEKTINGSPPDQRRQQRQLQSKPIAEALAAWADNTVRQLSRKSELAAAFRYMRARWTALVRCLDDGRLALDSNPAERALRCVAIGRKNYLFAGSDSGGRRAAAIYSLIESAKLNGLNPQHYIADVLTRIADHPARRITELLPWNWRPADITRAAA